MNRTDRHGARRLATAWGKSARWMRTLRTRVERAEAPRRMGRPRLGEEERSRVAALVRGELDRQGWTVGWRPILEAIREEEPAVSVMLVQQASGALKREARAEKERSIEEARVSHDVLCRDAVWAQDATHLGRLRDRRELQAELATDRASTAAVIAAVGRPAAGEDLVALLQVAATERGGLPLVWQSDGGSANTSACLASFLAANCVIHLRSRVHTPTDNAAAEHKNREAKEESGLGAGAVLDSAAAAAARLLPACARLDRRPRASRNWKSAAQLDAELPRADARVDRARFYAAARSAIDAALLGLSDPEQIRKAEQDAIWSTLERHGLARRHVGRRRTPSPTRRPAATEAFS